MDHDRHRPPRPIWLTLPGFVMQSMGIFVLPMATGTAVALIFESSEVIETFPAMLGFSLIFVGPIALLQLIGMGLKSRAEIQFWVQRRGLTISRLFDTLYSHTRVVTARGWSVLFAGLMFIGLSLALKWASFGTIAVFALFLFYTLVGWTLFLSTFIVGTFSRRLQSRTTKLKRSFIPAVCIAGDSVDEVLSFDSVPIPWGYRLVVSDPLHPRLATESRYLVKTSARTGSIEHRGRLRATPRGHYFLGPARFAYQDLLGLTDVSIASVASSELKVLPKIRPIEVIDPPRSNQEVPDVLTRPHRFATDDFFRFREYQAGDDTRRIHWRLSLKHGRLHVRLPENREQSTQDILLVIDSYLPRSQLADARNGADKILDALVDTALGIARDLTKQGDSVTLVAAASGHARDTIEIEHVKCKKNGVARWQDVGARVRWQSRFDIPELLGEVGDGIHGVVITSRFTAAPQLPSGGQTTTWCFMDPADAMGPKEGPMWQTLTGATTLIGILRWLLLLPYGAGSEENGLVARLVQTWRSATSYGHRVALRNAASKRAGQTQAELARRGDAVYRIERSASWIRLRGLHGRRAP